MRRKSSEGVDRFYEWRPELECVPGVLHGLNGVVGNGEPFCSGGHVGKSSESAPVRSCMWFAER